MGTDYFNPFNFIIGIDVSSISCRKDEYEILLIDQYFHITKTRNYAVKNNNDKKIYHLFTKLKIYKNAITDRKTFWKQIGFKIKNDDKEIISTIKKHPFLSQCTEYKNHTISQRIVDELGLNILNDD